MNELLKRKPNRLKDFDYGATYSYFITICTKNREKILSNVPTRQNTALSRFVSTFKRFCNKELGFNPWQGRFHDHIIRNKEDYEEVSKYIYNNPLNWEADELY